MLVGGWATYSSDSPDTSDRSSVGDSATLVSGVDPATPPSVGGGSVGSYSEYAEVAVTPPDSEGNGVGNRAGSVGWNT
jgi:hypothetical protein